MKPETLRQLAAVSTATVTTQLLKRGLRNCFILGARPLNPGQCRFAAQAYTLRFIPMREDLSRVEVLGDPEYPPRKVIEDIPPAWPW
jgi:regulator of RNase E activity RraA